MSIATSCINQIKPKQHSLMFLLTRYNIISATFHYFLIKRVEESKNLTSSRESLNFWLWLLC